MEAQTLGTLWITGASGRIGSRIAPMLRERGYVVRGFSGSPGDGLEPLPPTSEAMAGRMAGALAVVHLAAPNPSRLQAAFGGRRRLEQSHARLARLVGEAVLIAGLPRLVHVSSARVYGIQSGPYREDATPALPCDPYGHAKLAAEQVLTQLFSERPEGLTILRCPVVHGTGRRGAAGLTADLWRRGIAVPARIVDARKSVLAVENLAAAIARFSSPATPGGTFNIADPKPLTFGDYAGLFVPDDSLVRRRAQWPDWLLDMSGHAPVVGSAVRHLSSDCILECSKAEIAGWAPELGSADLVRARGYG